MYHSIYLETRGYLPGSVHIPILAATSTRIIYLEHRCFHPGDYDFGIVSDKTTIVTNGEIITVVECHTREVSLSQAMTLYVQLFVS